MDYENRLIELENRFAHQEVTVEQLNQAVIEQQQRIDALQQLCQQLASQIQDFQQPGEQADPLDEVPTHY